MIFEILKDTAAFMLVLIATMLAQVHLMSLATDDTSNEDMRSAFGFAFGDLGDYSGYSKL